MEEKTLIRRKNKQVSFRLTEKDFEKLNQKILKSNLTKQNFFEKLIDEKKIEPVQDLSKVILELNRIGINLNQIAKKVNSEEKLGVLKRIDMNKELLSSSEALKSILNSIKKKLGIN